MFLPQPYALSSWKVEPAINKEIGRLPTSRPPSNMDCLMAITRPNMACDAYNTIPILGRSCWLLIIWCLFGARASATIVMTPAYRRISEVSQRNAVGHIQTRILPTLHLSIYSKSDWILVDIYCMASLSMAFSLYIPVWCMYFYVTNFSAFSIEMHFKMSSGISQINGKSTVCSTNSSD